ncbi:aminodeoxyfutalosine synthase [Methylacidimicrobium cyclopophantes]|uniref:Aminodeoxyfutalosine synthase n=1 Tax=Methylacidimicrobium cyclopophantes TaxID=1041766 RepID=A0A5E6MFJ4_9BACT|nr:aminofutalosine synthase MqnE [Methylacidimicrobium cyclopophantes]VVM07767.1 aminodeoxyfutalosine synthase [Methylacidimicrobium cyclopophantes]
MAVTGFWDVCRKADILDIAERVVAGERIDERAALRLFDCPDTAAVGALADLISRRKNGLRASYLVNRYLNYSNICLLSCRFCAFYRRAGQPGAFLYSVEELTEQAYRSWNRGAVEVHCVGGLHPKLPFSYYRDLIAAIKERCPGMMVKAFTAVEIRHMADRIVHRSIQEVLEELAESGLDSLTGGGAEIFDAGVRDEICRGKETAEEWLEVHRTWHRMGKKSTATMLFGHVEKPAHRVDHLRRLRELQEETGGFCGFVPFAFEPANTKLSHIRRAGALDILRTIAVSRIYLDNFDHITSYWISSGLPLGQIALSFGADDLHGTIEEEKIFHMAGSNNPVSQKADDLAAAIRESGREPVARDTYYRVHPAVRPFRKAIGVGA